MLKKYSISDILDLPTQHIPYFVGTFEGTDDPEAEWPHRHSFFSIVWFTKGSGSYVIDFDEYDIQPDRIFFVNPTQIHNWDYSENSEGYIITIDETLSEGLIISQLPYIDIDESLKEILKIILSSLVDNKQTGNDLITDIQYVATLIDRFIRKHQLTQRLVNPTINNLKQLLSENQNTLFTIEQFAEKLGISTTQLNNICKKYVGTSAKQYILELKLTEAKRLLLYSDHNINEVSFGLGFEDSSYFSRIFKNKTSLSPSNFRRKYRNR